MMGFLCVLLIGLGLAVANAPAVVAGGAGVAELIDVDAVAVLLGCSKRHVMRLADSGRMPPPVRLGHLVRWRRTDVLTWINGGCRSMRVAQAAAR
jgi:excisionase family DNA binding protein